jgi:hypothetical protein
MHKERTIFALIASLLLIINMATFRVVEERQQKSSTDTALQIDSLKNEIQSLRNVAAMQMTISTELLGEITPEEAVKLLKAHD